MKVAFDLHNHTSLSKDGMAPGLKLLEMARSRGLAGIGLCDHDEFPDPTLAAEAKRLGIKLAQGVEFSCRQSHVIGYNMRFDPCDRAFLEKRFDILRQSYAEVTRYILGKLRKRGLRVDYEKLEKFAGKTPQKLFLLRYLSQEMGLFNSWSEARRYLIGEGLYVSDNAGVEMLDPAEAVSLIRRAGGVAIWAHPYFTPEPLRERYFNELIEAGLDGIEGVYAYQENGYRGPESNAEIERLIRARVKGKGLIISGGSDSHYPLKTHADLNPIIPGDFGVSGLDPETKRRLFG